MLKAKDTITLKLKEGKKNEVIIKGNDYDVVIDKGYKILVKDENGDNRFFKPELFEEIVEEKKSKKKKKKESEYYAEVINEEPITYEEESEVEDNGQRDDIQDDVTNTEPENNNENVIQY